MAADGLERLFAAWRGDATERALRLRTAELRSQAGQWRAIAEVNDIDDPLRVPIGTRLVLPDPTDLGGRS